MCVCVCVRVHSSAQKCTRPTDLTHVHMHYYSKVYITCAHPSTHTEINYSYILYICTCHRYTHQSESGDITLVLCSIKYIHNRASRQRRQVGVKHLLNPVNCSLNRLPYVRNTHTHNEDMSGRGRDGGLACQTYFRSFCHGMHRD